MAEEEVLEEAAPPPPQKKGGGFSIGHFIGLVVVIVLVGVVVYLLIAGQLGKTTDDIENQIRNIPTTGDYRTSDASPLETCASDDLYVVPLTEQEPFIVMLADGDHYLSIGISLCVRAKAGDLTQFQKQKDVVKHIINEHFSTYSYSDFFPTAGEEAMDTGTDDIYGEETSDKKYFLMKKDEVRVELLRSLKGRGLKFVEDVYFTEFLIQ